jgi:hypothetical protein
MDFTTPSGPTFLHEAALVDGALGRDDGGNLRRAFSRPCGRLKGTRISLLPGVQEEGSRTCYGKAF